MRSGLIAAVLCVSLLASAARAHADEARLAPSSTDERSTAPPVAWGLVAGTLTGMVPLAIGSLVFAQDDDSNHRKAASLTIAYGMSLAPIVSHLVVHEWSRAAIFGAVPLACAIGVTALLQAQPTATSFGSRTGRWGYGLLMSVNVLSAGLGVIDTLGAGGRARDHAAARRRLARIPVLPAPFVTIGGGGLTAVGAF